MNWRGVDEAIAVSETGSFTEAAEMLNTTVASVSRRISDLEERLGVKLFTRTTRFVALNAEGENYIARCREAMTLLRSAEDEIHDQHDQLTGQIRITAAIEFGERVIAPSIAAFQAHHPEVSVELELSNERQDLVKQKFDLAVRLGELPDSSLVARKIGERRLMVCAAPDYLAQHGEPQKLEDLRKHNCLRGTARQWRFRQNGSNIHQQITGTARCNSGTAITSLALRGLGLAQLPDYYVEQHINNGRLIEVLSDHQPAPEGIWIVRPDNRFVPRRVRAFVDLLTKELDGTG